MIENIFLVALILLVFILPWCTILVFLCFELFRIRDRLHRLEGRDATMLMHIEESNKLLNRIEQLKGRDNERERKVSGA